MKYRWRREEEETRQMYEMVERIVGKEMLIILCVFFCVSKILGKCHAKIGDKQVYISSLQETMGINHKEMQGIFSGCVYHII